VLLVVLQLVAHIATMTEVAVTNAVLPLPHGLQWVLASLSAVASARAAGTWSPGPVQLPV
jgi:ligand-binding SRPBCC domain-containing protein